MKEIKNNIENIIESVKEAIQEIQNDSWLNQRTKDEWCEPFQNILNHEHLLKEGKAFVVYEQQGYYSEPEFHIVKNGSDVHWHYADDNMNGACRVGLCYLIIPKEIHPGYFGTYDSYRGLIDFHLVKGEIQFEDWIWVDWRNSQHYEFTDRRREWRKCVFSGENWYA